MLDKPKPPTLGRFVVAPVLALIGAGAIPFFWSVVVPWLLERAESNSRPTRYQLLYDKVPLWLVFTLAALVYGGAITWWAFREARRDHAKICETIDAEHSAKAEAAQLRKDLEKTAEFMALTGLINVNIWRGELVMTAATLFVYMFGYLPQFSVKQIVHQIALAFEISDSDAQQFFTSLIGPCLGHLVIEPWPANASGYRSTPLGAKLHALALSKKWTGIDLRPMQQSGKA